MRWSPYYDGIATMRFRSIPTALIVGLATTTSEAALFICQTWQALDLTEGELTRSKSHSIELSSWRAVKNDNTDCHLLNMVTGIVDNGPGKLSEERIYGKSSVDNLDLIPFDQSSCHLIEPLALFRPGLLTHIRPL